MNDDQDFSPFDRQVISNFCKAGSNNIGDYKQKSDVGHKLSGSVSTGLSTTLAKLDAMKAANKKDKNDRATVE